MDILYHYQNYLQTLGFSPKTIYGKLRSIKNFIGYIKKKESKITLNDLEDYMEHIKAKKLHSRTQYQYYGNVKDYFSYLQQNKTIRKNPFDSYIIQLKKEPYKERTVLSRQEIQSMYAQTKSLKEKIILHLCYGCGLRALELERINIQDIDLANKILIVQKGKNSKRRIIPINITLQKDFVKYLQYRNRIKTEEKALLLNDIHTRMKEYTALAILKKILKRSQINKQITLHSLRHSIATHLLENGVKIEFVKDFLGHKYLDTTELYTRVNSSNL